MTPGLAGFVASGGDASAWDAVLAEVIASLQQGFNVVPERAPAGATRRTWLDTFDWRLHRAGLVLEHEAARRGGELRLTTANAANYARPPASTQAATRQAASTQAATRQAASTQAATRQAASPPAPQAPQVPRAPQTPHAPQTPRPPTTRNANTPSTTQPVTGWHVSRPHLMPDFPDGPIAPRIARLVEPRALLPVVTVSSTLAVSRLLNQDGKTVARLLVEHVHVAAGEQKALPPRMTITEVRGYPGQARRAARLVALTPGVLPATESVFVDALRAIGRHPGDYSNKVDAPITADMPAADAVAAIMLRLLNTIEVNVEGVVHDTDTEFLHDLRVSVRRTRSALKLFGDVLAAPTAGNKPRLSEDDVTRFAAEFKWVGDMTTPTRDLDVHLLGFEETARTLRAAKPDDLEPFRGYLEQRRVKEFRALARGLRSPRFTQLVYEWRAALTKLSAQKRNGKTDTPLRSGQLIRRGGETARTLAVERTRRAFVKVAKRGAAITPASPHESLHDLRKRCKELRYALEFFAPVHDPAAYGKVLSDLKRLQDCLGEFQDSEVQIDEVRVLAAAMLNAGEAPAVTLLAMGEVTAGLAARQAAARADFERRFAAFAGRDGRHRMSVLLRGGAG